MSQDVVSGDKWLLVAALAIGGMLCAGVIASGSFSSFMFVVQRALYAAF